MTYGRTPRKVRRLRRYAAVLGFARVERVSSAAHGCPALELHSSSERQTVRAKRATRGQLVGWKIGRVDGVHRGPLTHVGQYGGAFHDLLEGRASAFQRRANVREGLTRF